MASSNRILGLKPVELALIGGGGYLLLSGKLNGVFSGIGSAFQGVGGGVGSAFQGTGQGVGNAFEGVGTGIGTAGLGLGEGIGAIGTNTASYADLAGEFARQAQEDVQQAYEVRRESEDRINNLLLQERTAYQGEQIKSSSYLKREGDFQQGVGYYVNAFSSVGGGVSDVASNLRRTASSVSSIPADFSGGIQRISAGLGTRAIRGGSIVLSGANSGLSQLFSGINKVNVPSPRPVSPPLSSTVSAYTPAQASYDPNIAIAKQASIELQRKAKISQASLSPKGGSSGSKSSFSQVKTSSLKAPAGFTTGTFKVGSQTFTRTYKIK